MVVIAWTMVVKQTFEDCTTEYDCKTTMKVCGGKTGSLSVTMRLENGNKTTQVSGVKPWGVCGAICGFYFQVLGDCFRSQCSLAVERRQRSREICINILLVTQLRNGMHQSCYNSWAEINATWRWGRLGCSVFLLCLACDWMSKIFSKTKFSNNEYWRWEFSLCLRAMRTSHVFILLLGVYFCGVKNSILL